MATTPSPTAGGADVAQAFMRLEERQDVHEYNFEHFEAKHLLTDIKLTVAKAGIPPGQSAPDFALPRVGGGTLRLSELRGRPVLLHFGSFT